MKTECTSYVYNSYSVLQSSILVVDQYDKMYCKTLFYGNILKFLILKIFFYSMNWCWEIINTRPTLWNNMVLNVV